MASNLTPSNIAGVSFPTDASQISAAGVAGASTFLRGDGSWAVPETGGERVSLPFSKTRVKTKALTANDGLHHTFYVMTVVLPAGRWLMFNRSSQVGHSGVDLNASIYMRISRDKGTTWTNPVAIFTADGTFDPRGLVAKLMGNGRIGLIIPRCPEAGTYISPAFVWSDDGGATWSSKILTEVSEWAGSSTDIYQYPASVGGHDTEGFIAYAATGHNTANVMAYLKTEDNGETWQSGTAMPNVPGVELSSLGVVRLGTTNRWVALVRDADTSINPVNERNGLCYKSTDMLTWSGPYDTGQMINNNPLNAMYYNGLVYFIAANRVYMNRPILQNGITLPDGFVHQWEDAEVIWINNGTVWPGWSDLVSAGRLEGHPTFFYDEEGSVYANFGFNLKNLGTPNFSSMIGLMSNVQIGMDFSRLLINMPDYQFGAWTPTLTFETPGDLAVTYGSFRSGRYVKFGNLVYVWGEVQGTPTYTTASGRLKIGGLPFSPEQAPSSRLHAISLNNTTWPDGATAIDALCNPERTISIRGFGPGTTLKNFEAANAPSGQQQFWSVAGAYRVQA